MQDGFIRVAAVSFRVRAASPVYNCDEIIKYLDRAKEEKAVIAVFPELCTAGASAGDAYAQRAITDGISEVIDRVVEYSKSFNGLIVLGSALRLNMRLLDAAVVINKGHIIGIVPKSNNASGRFSPYEGSCEISHGEGEPYEVPVTDSLIFRWSGDTELSVGVFFDGDYETAASIHDAGATVLLELTAEHATVCSVHGHRQLSAAFSKQKGCCLVRASAGAGESTTDGLYEGYNLIAARGHILAESEPFRGGFTSAVIDYSILTEDYEGRDNYSEEDAESVFFDADPVVTELSGVIRRSPFIPEDCSERNARMAEILSIQTLALKTRLENIHCQRAVIGISGGLDSTLALICAVSCFDELGLDRSEITAVTMPCFGTTDRTYHNACRMAESFGVTLLEIPVGEAVKQHFSDIGHDIAVRNSAYENSQARERTQVLMDLANDLGAIVIGTGDLSELALGWATYNGDHMSMYGVNAGIPKTVVRALVTWYAEQTGDTELAAYLKDVVATPVSPELLPADGQKISQKTEDIVGPYELHDFFIYYALRFGFRPEKILRMAIAAFEGEYDSTVIKKWLRVFYGRFYTQQFKRSCMPDGPRIGSVCLSPRGALCLPSDINGGTWTGILDNM